MGKDAVAYIRISTTEQNPENQRLAIVKYAERHGYKIVKTYVDEGVSGSIPPLRRRGFWQLVKDLELGRVEPEVILVYEVSRIGRNLRESLDAIWRLERYAPVIPVSSKESWLQTLDKNIRDLVLTVLAWAAERERLLLIERTREGMMRARLMGKHIGRPRKEIDRREVIRYLNKGIPKSTIAKILGVSRTTLYKRLNEWGYSPGN